MSNARSNKMAQFVQQLTHMTSYER